MKIKEIVGVINEYQDVTIYVKENGELLSHYCEKDCIPKALYTCEVVEIRGTSCGIEIYI